MKKGLQLETVDCPLCAGKEFGDVVRRADGLSIVRCGACGLAFLNPRPVAEEISRLYEHDYYDGETGRGVGYSAYSRSASVMKSYPPYMWNLLQQEAPIRPGWRTLDIGCAFGHMVYWMSKAGARATGIDLSSEGVTWGRKKLGLDLRQTTLEALEEPDGSFDLVTMIDLIEHVPDLSAFMARLKALLKPGGVAFVQTPNFESFQTWGQRHVFLRFSLEHLLYFEAATLSELFRRSGMVPVREPRVLLTIPCDAEAFAAQAQASRAEARSWRHRLPGVGLLRWIKARLAPPGRVYRFDETRRRGACLVGVYRKATEDDATTQEKGAQ